MEVMTQTMDLLKDSYHMMIKENPLLRFDSSYADGWLEAKLSYACRVVYTKDLLWLCGFFCCQGVSKENLCFIG